MKKIYIQPGMKVVHLKRQLILSGSVKMYGRNATGDAMSREFEDDFDDFDE